MSQTHTETYVVTGMTCEHCAASVREELAEIPTVESVDVVVDTGVVTVHSTAPVARDAVSAAVTEAGYELA